MNSKNLIILCLVAVVSTICYQVASGNTQVIENFWNTGMGFMAKPEITQNGFANPEFVNNTPILGYNTNPLINTDVFSPSELEALPSRQKENFDPRMESRNNVPVFEVPGTKQSYLPPRMNPNGLGSYVNYKIPNENELASNPADPLSVAGGVLPREDFVGETPSENQEQVKALRGQGSLVFNELPVSPMTNSLGTETDNEFFVNSERLIFALKKDRNTGNGCMIRGDLGIIPNNGQWFQVPANPATLTQGALMAIAGPTNVTAQQAPELSMRATAGTDNTYGGGTLAVPPNTFVSNLENMNTINMGNQIDLKTSFKGASPLVQTTAFP